MCVWPYGSIGNKLRVSHVSGHQISDVTGSSRSRMMRFICVCTCRESRPGPGSLHLLPSVREHVVPLGFVHEISARLGRFDQLFVVHYVEQVGRMDEGKADRCQEIGQMLGKSKSRRTEVSGVNTVYKGGFVLI